MRGFFFISCIASLNFVLFYSLFFHCICFCLVVCVILEDCEAQYQQTTMASPTKWDNRVMFERYLYDYFIKNNMHETAEIFRKETNIEIDPMTPPAIDVPDGFLHEWWLVFSDMFNAQQPRNVQHNEGTSIMVEQMMKTRPQSGASSSKEYQMSEQTLGRLDLNADLRLITGDNLLPPMGWSLTGTEQISQGLSSSEHRQEALASQSGILYPPGNFINLVGQEVGSSVHAASRLANVAPNERSRKRKYPSDSEDGSSSMPGLAYFPSVALSEIQKSLDDRVKLSSSHGNNSKDRGGASFSDFLTCSISPEANISKGANLLQLMGWPLTGTEKISQGLSSSQHQQELLASQSGTLYPPSNLVGFAGQEVGSSVHAVSRMANVAPNERSRNGKNPSDSEDRSSSMPGLANLLSEALPAIQNSSDGHAKPSSSHANDEKDGGGVSFSDLVTCSINPEAGALKDELLLGGILVKYKLHNFMHATLIFVYSFGNFIRAVILILSMI